MPGAMGGSLNPYGQLDSNPSIAPSNPVLQFGSPASFSTAATQQAGDYDTIMKNYQELLKKQQDPTSNVNAQPLEPFKPITPTLTPYTTSPDMSASMSNLSGLAANGGYSNSAIDDIRARDISPIRSIYASAQQGLERQKALQGGYSPNYTAASVKMARDLSDQIGKKTTDVNARIAEEQAAGRLSIAPTWSYAAASENAARTAAEQHNADVTNSTNELNARLQLAYQQQQQQQAQQQQSGMFGTIEGMRGLYGTTPALTSTFGQQVAQASQLGQGQQQINNQRRNASFGMAGGVLNG